MQTEQQQQQLIRFKVVDDTVPPPALQTQGSVGYDVVAHSVAKSMDGGNIVLINTGVACQPPPGHFFQLHERSSLHKLGWVLCNSVGVVDMDYTGWVMAALMKVRDNATPVEELVEGRLRICQLVLHKACTEFPVEVVDSLDATERGEGGFGSTNQ